MMVKTHLSLSADPTRKGVPKGWILPVRDVLVFAGAKFLCPVTGTISLMPGTRLRSCLQKGRCRCENRQGEGTILTERGKEHDGSIDQRQRDRPADPEELKEETARLKEKFDVAPGLVTILVGQNPASMSYVTAKQKASKELGFHSIQENQPETITGGRSSGLDRPNTTGTPRSTASSSSFPFPSTSTRRKSSTPSIRRRMSTASIR